MATTYKFSPVDLHGKNKNAAKPVIAIFGTGDSCKFPSIHDAARMMNVPESNIVMCLKGRLKTAGGCRWIYAESGQAPQREDV